MFMPALVYSYPTQPPPYVYRSLLYARNPQGKVAELAPRAQHHWREEGERIPDEEDRAQEDCRQHDDEQ